MFSSRTVFAGAVNSRIPAAKLLGALSSVQDVCGQPAGNPFESTAHNETVKTSPSGSADLIRILLRMYPLACGPVVNLCARSRLRRECRPK